MCPATGVATHIDQLDHPRRKQQLGELCLRRRAMSNSEERRGHDTDIPRQCTRNALKRCTSADRCPTSDDRGSDCRQITDLGCDRQPPCRHGVGYSARLVAFHNSTSRDIAVDVGRMDQDRRYVVGNGATMSAISARLRRVPSLTAARPGCDESGHHPGSAMPPISVAAG